MNIIYSMSRLTVGTKYLKSNIYTVTLTINCKINNTGKKSSMSTAPTLLSLALTEGLVSLVALTAVDGVTPLEEAAVDGVTPLVEAVVDGVNPLY